MSTTESDVRMADQAVAVPGVVANGVPPAEKEIGSESTAVESSEQGDKQKMRENSKASRHWSKWLGKKKAGKGSIVGGNATKPGARPRPPRFRVNPFINAFMRLTGEWPLTGPVPVSESRYKRLFAAAPSFVDFFPLVDFDDKEQVYRFDDGINVAGIWKVESKYMAARSKAALEQFNMALTQAINTLPGEDDRSIPPYIVQVYLHADGNNSIGDDLEAAMAENGVLDDPYSREILRVNREHADLLSHKNGIFPDSRMNDSQGWRIGDQNVYLCIYGNRPEKFWKRNKRTPVEQLRHDMSAFMTVLRAADVRLSPLQPHELIAWLAPYFGSERPNRQQVQGWQKTASFDVGQKIFAEQPVYHDSEDPREQGIWRFGDAWLRYLTIGGIDSPPRDGEMTLGQTALRGGNAAATDSENNENIGASLFEHLPSGAMVSYTIVPQSDYHMKAEISRIQMLSEDGASREARYASEQAHEVQEEMLRNKQRVFYAQLGVYLKSPSLRALLDDTEQTVAKIKASGCIEVIEQRYDLISQDSFIRALPAVYDFAHDRKASLRARKCYTSHLASLLPFYGNKAGSKHPCYIMYSRTGEPFYMNPFHTDDREKVSHELFFGPSGSGKSASICYMAMQSMAVNNPRMFLFDYGNSFGLLADYMERYGKKVKRFVLNSRSKDVVAPFFETAKALKEYELAKQISDGTWVPPEENLDQDEAAIGEEDEKRSYLAEMAYIAEIMITGGTGERLSQSQRKYVLDALVRGMQLSVEEGEPHARPIHIAKAMRMLADEESASEHALPKIVEMLREMSNALYLWTQGERGLLFNRTAEGFSPDYDLTLVELGALGKEGSEDMLAVAGLSAIYTITAMAEKLQGSGRSIEVKIDEAHLWAKIKLLIEGLVVGVKVFRKLGCWLTIITQDITDFKGVARKILGNAEFWWLMRMDEKEIREALEILNLSEEGKQLIRHPRKEEKRFVEGISKSAKFPDALIRYIPPSLMLALGQTDDVEKRQRRQLMKEHGVSELDAALMIADEITAIRRRYQEIGV